MPSKDKVTDEAYKLLENWIKTAVYKKDSYQRRVVLEMLRDEGVKV